MIEKWEGHFINFGDRKLQEMAMYPALEHYAIFLGISVTGEQLKNFIFNDRSGKALKNIISDAKNTYSNASVEVILQKEIESRPFTWNKYSEEDKALILNLVQLIDQVDID